jgi:hypothetical protein
MRASFMVPFAFRSSPKTLIPAGFGANFRGPLGVSQATSHGSLAIDQMVSKITIRLRFPEVMNREEVK